MEDEQAASFRQPNQVGHGGSVQVSGEHDALLVVVHAIGHRWTVAVMGRASRDPQAVDVGNLTRGRIQLDRKVDSV